LNTYGETGTKILKLYLKLERKRWNLQHFMLQTFTTIKQKNTLV